MSLGGGSSLDVAKVVSTLAALDRPREAVAGAFAETGTIPVPDEGLLPIVAVPTTLAGADLSQVAGVTAAPDSGLVDEEVSGGISGPALMPAAAVCDPELVATTPEPILAGSAMNGFDKGLETLYASNATPVTDATASRGLRSLVDGLRAFGEGERDLSTFETIVEGTVLVQYGISRPGETTISIVHAFGHGLTRTYDVQQELPTPSSFPTSSSTSSRRRASTFGRPSWRTRSASTTRLIRTTRSSRPSRTFATRWRSPTDSAMSTAPTPTSSPLSPRVFSPIRSWPTHRRDSTLAGGDRGYSRGRLVARQVDAADRVPDHESYHPPPVSSVHDRARRGPARSGL